MLAVNMWEANGPGAVTLVLMHFLGGSTREWDEVRGLLGPEIQAVAVDMPGFGSSAGIPGYSVAEMADAVDATLARLPLGRYVLVGHSMSGKVSAVLARRYADGGLQNKGMLAGLVMIAPSPPGPEPMTEYKRSQMLGSLGVKREDDPDGERARARSYVTKNDERDILPAALERTVDEVLRMNRTAWVAWLQHGSKEDWAERVGVLDLPALIVAGDKDKSLGPDTQREVTLPHLAHGSVRAVKGSSHLIPLERPEELAGILREFIAGLPAPADESSLPPAYAAFMASDRLSEPTRQVLTARFQGPKPSDVLTPAQLHILQAVCARVVPQQGTDVDIAGTIAARLATGKGDGWRYAVLPPDPEAYRQQLDALAMKNFADLPTVDQDTTLQALMREPKAAAGRWFEELRGEAAEVYVSHPRTMARLGFSGPGVGGAYTANKGFVAIEMGQVEAWEPAPEQTEIR